jgi:prepilin-type N-terminal cleavage/methylation domain-containing protein
MNSRGFTLVELIVVLALITILTTLGTMSWKRMSMKSAVEGQIKTVHADMMKIRLEALYGKRERRVKFNGKTFNIYSSNVETTTPLEAKSFKYPFKYATTRSAFVFNTSGMASGYEGSVCVDPYSNLAIKSDAAVDSLVITDGRISLGKRIGDGCVSDDITKK